MSASRTGRLYPQKMFLVLTFTRGRGTPGRNMSLKNPVTPPGIDPGTIRLVAQRLIHYATQGSELEVALYKKKINKAPLYAQNWEKF